MNICKWCGREGKYHFKINDEYCCSKYPQQCPEFKKKLSSAKKGVKRSKESIKKQSQTMLGVNIKPQYKLLKKNDIRCSYGCGKIAKYKFKNGKYCCDIDYRKCTGFITNKKYMNKGSPSGEKIINEYKILCSYGCGKIAKYKFKNGKYCCSEFAVQCSFIHPTVSDETKKILSDLNKKPIEYWKTNYPLFFKVEKVKKTTNGILVQCKNEKCKRFFKPTYIQLYERIRNVEREDGGGDYFYCSNECKKSCSIFNQKKISKRL